MKKIAFILSLIVFSGGFTSAQANTLEIDKTYLAKISLAESEHKAALVKWDEVDQVKLNNFKPFSWPFCGKSNCEYAYSFFNPRANGGIHSGILKYQDNPHAFMQLIELVDFDACYSRNTWSCSQSNVYQLKDKGDRGPKWDFEGMYGSSIHWGTVTAQIVAFRHSLLVPVKNDGSPVSLAEFEAIRSLVKSTYVNIQTLKNEYTNAINDYYAAEAKKMQKAMEEAAAKAKEEADAKLALEQREQWAKETNKYLSSYFPAKAKSNLMKQGYFKPLKTTSYTYETGRYIANARVSGNTATVTGYWETKTVYDVPTKKEQAAWIKESNDKLNHVTKQYSTLIAEARMRGYTVVCAANTPCRVLF
jgi:hypothetical protein